MSAKPRQRHQHRHGFLDTHDTQRPRLDDTFECERREQAMALHACMTDYVNANALAQKGSPCFRCEVGLENRDRFAKEG